MMRLLLLHLGYIFLFLQSSSIAFIHPTINSQRFNSPLVTFSSMSEAKTTQTTSTSKSLEEMFTELLDKDGKQRIGSYSTPAFLAATLIGMPMYFGVVLPLAIVTTLGKKVMSSSSPIPLKLSGFDDDEKFPKLSEIKPMKDRKYDLVYLGATGFAGKLALGE